MYISPSLNAKGEKIPLMVNGMKIGYVVLYIVNENNRDNFLAENRYVQEFINLMPRTFGVVGKIYITERERNKGYGTQIMYQIIEFFRGKVDVVHLIPHPIAETKTQVDGMQFHLWRLRLVEFYKRFNFMLDDERYVEPKNLKVAHLKPMFLTLNS